MVIVLGFTLVQNYTGTQKVAEVSSVTPATNQTSTPQTVEKENTNSTKELSTIKNTDSISMKNTLFIGDSRTVGLMEYAQIEDAHFFCNVGLSVFNIYDNSVSVPHVGKVTLEQLLNSKKYSKIYIMLGVNEMGYPFKKIISQYKQLITFIQEREPSVKIMIMANLHVTQSRSQNDKTFNNHAINRLNTTLRTFADSKSIFYLDANALFDDQNGALSADKSSDNAHLYAKYYKEWGNWIIQQTSLLLKEE